MITDIAFTLARRFAPHLARRIAGDRAGEIAERIVSMGRELTGASDPAAIEARLEQDAELAHTFSMRAADLDAELEKAYLADRADAREMRLRLAELGHTDWMMYAVGLIVVIGLVATVLAVFFIDDLNPAQLNLLNVLGGGLLAGFMAVVQYFFGSSRGSAEKTRLMSAGPQPGERRSPPG